MPQHRISVCLEPSENAKYSSKTSFCESLELESDQIEKLEDIFNSEDLREESENHKYFLLMIIGDPALKFSFEIGTVDT